MQTPGQRWAGRFPQKQVSRRRRDLQWKRARPRVTWLGSGRGPRKSSGLRDGAPRSGSCGNRLRGRRGGSRQPGTCSSPPKEAAGTAERGRGTGRGASPGRARLSSLLGRAAPPRPAPPPPPPSSPRAEQPARRAAGSGSASEPAAACGRAAGGAVSQPRSWNLKGQAPRGRGVCAPAKGTRDSRRVRPRRGAPGGPAAKFPAGMAGERPRPASPPLPNAEHRLQGESRKDFCFSPLEARGEMICMLNKSCTYFQPRSFPSLGTDFFHRKHRETNGVGGDGHSLFYVRIQAETRGFGGKVVAGKYSCQTSWEEKKIPLFLSQSTKHLLFPSGERA